ncbi:MAG TPA: S4 domain-containing protein [Candidatus Dormibacteraeota bacterium]|nr:S4 domain-containing protein [Candidatus Dormibacteraeota bacterium]
MLERIQKIIAQAGIASRRRAEDLIVSGQVEVNGKIVAVLGTKADPERDSIRVGGKPLRLPQQRVSLALNKPDACVSSLADPSGRATLQDCLRGVSGRVFPVGGLEYHSTGLILLTSDGDFAARLFSGLRGGLPQTYQVKIKNPLTPGEMQTITRRVCPIRVYRPGPNPWYEVRLLGARQDRLRNLLFEIGHPVEKLKRVAIGPIELGEIKSGRWRILTPEEIRALEAELTRLEALPSRSRGKKRRKPEPRKA